MKLYFAHLHSSYFSVSFSTFAMIKPIPTNTVGKILSHFHENGLRITKLKKSRLTTEDINILYRSLIGDPTFP